MLRKGSHPDRKKKKGTSTSSERKDPSQLQMLASVTNMAAKMHTRHQLQTQARQQRVTSHSRV